ncbi:hypothetical protein M3Y96_00827700 [Aphelenchoides besseyi]|nr:hypothetical protein M3Y96_00827700 [Aphelenchoides besseyi]
MRDYLYAVDVPPSAAPRAITPRTIFSDQPLKNKSGVLGVSNTKIRTTPQPQNLPFSLDVKIRPGSPIRKSPLSRSISSEEPFSTQSLVRYFGVEKVQEGRIEESVARKEKAQSIGAFVQQKSEANTEDDLSGTPTSSTVDQTTIDQFFENSVPDENKYLTSISTNIHELPPPPSFSATSTDDIEQSPNTNGLFEVSENPFERMVAQPAATISQNWPARAINDDARLEQSTNVIPTPPSEVHIFGPPFLEKNQKSPPPMFGMQHVDAPTPTVLWREGITSPSLAVDSLTNFGQQHSRLSPWSWKDVANKLKKKPFYTLESRPEFDQSSRCCQWALDGLCDRSWQRIRTLCPPVDGALSCNRAIDVDVIDCYERRKFRTHGINNHRLHPTASVPLKPAATENKDGVDIESEWIKLSNDKKEIPQEFKTPTTQSSFLHRAFAIEDEIRSFRKLLKP